MSQNFLHNASFHLVLVQIDQSLADEAQQKGCDCGGRLDRADYPRSPFGLSPSLREHYQERFSYCCHNCRKRSTPMSVRFFGRRWFPAPLLLLICILKRGVNERRLHQVRRYFGITLSESTWKRWRAWWRDVFEKTAFWKQNTGVIPPSLLDGKATTRFPRVLLSLFRVPFEEKLRSLLRFLAPLTSGGLCAV